MLFSVNTISKDDKADKLNYVICAENKESALEIFKNRYMKKMDIIKIIDIVPVESDFIRVYEIEEITPYSFYVSNYTDVDFEYKPLTTFDAYVIKAFGKEMTERNVSTRIINSKVTLVVAIEYHHPLFMNIFKGNSFKEE